MFKMFMSMKTCRQSSLQTGQNSIPIPFSPTEALSDSLMPSIIVASSSVLRRRDRLRRFAGNKDSLASVSAVWSVSVFVSKAPWE